MRLKHTANYCSEGRAGIPHSGWLNTCFAGSYALRIGYRPGTKTARFSQLTSGRMFVPFSLDGGRMGVLGKVGGTPVPADTGVQWGNP